MHPPANRRCQIYYKAQGATMEELVRCRNEGTHWEKWPGCGCADTDPDVCCGDFFSWECDNIHNPDVAPEADAC